MCDDTRDSRSVKVDTRTKEQKAADAAAGDPGGAARRQAKTDATPQPPTKTPEEEEARRSFYATRNPNKNPLTQEEDYELNQEFEKLHPQFPRRNLGMAPSLDSKKGPGALPDYTDAWLAKLASGEVARVRASQGRKASFLAQPPGSLLSGSY